MGLTDGKTSGAPKTITTVSPNTNEPIITREEPSLYELAALPRRSLDAFNNFSKTTLSYRQNIVQKALKLLRERKDELARELTQQMGRPIAYGAKEITTAADRGDYMLKISSDVLSDTPGDPEDGFQRYIKKKPLGPVLVLFAWNYPYLILVNSLIPALLAGNTVILKPSPQTPTVAEQAQRLFLDAGLPADVVQYFHCADKDMLHNVLNSPSIKLVCFTGSVNGGVATQEAVSRQVDVRVCLELGGKDPAYIRPDVDVKWAAEEIVDGAIFNSGQSCCSLERVYVHESVHDDFVTAAQNLLKSYTLGDPFDEKTQIGPVISQRAMETIQSHVNDALQKGAVDATPANQSFENVPHKGNFFAPKLLTNVTHDMKLMREETFGPIIPVMKVKSDDEAVTLMNDSEFGLTASIWTKDVRRGRELADEVEAGTCFVNRADFPSPDLAWTGWKESGKGQSLSRFGFDQFVRLKSYHLKDYPK